MATKIGFARSSRTRVNPLLLLKKNAVPGQTKAHLLGKEGFLAMVVSFVENK